MSEAGAQPPRVLIVGGGTAGWMCAATLANTLPASVGITVLDIPGARDSAVLQPATPAMPAFAAPVAALGFDERGWLRATQGAFRLGDQFHGWHGGADACLLPLGEVGAKFESVPFLQQWLRLRAAGEVAAYTDHSLAALAALRGRFSHPSPDPRSVLSILRYGWHLDTAACAGALRAAATRAGVRVVDDEPGEVHRRGSDGFLTAVTAGGRQLEAEFFIDCTGDAALLAHGALGLGWQSWQSWFPCDRHISSVCAAQDPGRALLTSRTAARAGWSWSMTTRAAEHRGLAYSSAHLADDAAAHELAGENTAGVTQPVKFHSGRRERFWQGNVLALGHAACCLDPLRGTDLMLLQTSVAHLLALFPAGDGRVESHEYNRVVGEMLERVRDHVLLLYAGASRDDSPFWEHCRHLALPETLAYKVAQFRARGRVVLGEEESFDEHDWTAALVGLGMLPGRFDPLAEAVPLDKARSALERLRDLLQRAVDSMPPAREYLERYLGS